ncbi:MAG: UbiA family prenyltransferase [Syntrophaceae bacterium]|nr:UbiA family prenyltransferase [Syntrophaceae bacterium]
MRNLWKSFFNERLHIVLSSLALLWCWDRILSIGVRPVDYFIVPLAVACICQWNRLTDLREDAVNCPEELEEALKREPRIRFFSYAGGVTAIVLALATDPTWPVAAIVVAGAAVGFFYSTSPWPGRATLRIKNLFILKNLSSGVGWTLGLLVYPALRAGHSLDGPFWLASVYMFLAVMAHEIVWDMRDAAGDRAAEVPTLPVVAGVGATKAIVLAAMIALASLVAVSVASRVVPSWWLLLIPHAGLLAVVTAQFDGWFHSSRLVTYLLVVMTTVFSFGMGLLASRLS